MDENTDPKIVVMDRDVYDRLRYLAGVGSGEVQGRLDQCDRHVRRFNSALRDEASAQHRREIEMRRVARLAAYDLVRRKQGQEVYHRMDFHRFVPGKLLGITRRPDGYPLLRIHRRGTARPSEIHPGQIAEALPDGAKLFSLDPRTYEPLAIT